MSFRAGSGLAAYPAVPREIGGGSGQNFGRLGEPQSLRRKKKKKEFACEWPL